MEEVDRKREKLVAEIAARSMDIRKTFLDLPFTANRRNRVEHAFYSELLADLYWSGRVPQLYLIAAQAVLHALSAGMDEAVMYAFTAMAIYHAEHEEFEQSFAYEDLTYDLAAKHPNTFAATKCMTGAVVTLMHSRSHPRDVADYSLKAIRCGKNCGDLNNAGYSYGPLMWNLQLQGADLSVIEDHTRECLQFSGRYHLGIAAGLAEAVRAGWVEPMKKDSAPVAIEETLARWERDNHIASVGSYYVLRAATCYYMEESEEAEQCLVSGRKHLAGFSNSILKREWFVFKVLNALGRYEKSAGSADKEKLLTEIRPAIGQIERWAALGPSLTPYLAFIYAEQERVAGDFKEARSLYADAINVAHELNYTLLEGQMNERLGELLLKAGQHSARLHFVEAARLYRTCRAGRKEVNLLEKYSEYFEEETAIAVTDIDAAVVLPNLDVDYLMKSAFAISAEMEQEALLKKIMNVISECSGARDGYLLIEEKGSLIVRSESHIAEKQNPRALDRRLEEVQDICKAIVRYVSRTGERVILGNACQEGEFRDNPEVRERRLRSVLCLPVVKQSKRMGILYLENSLIDSAFTAKKTQMTELLASQAAISLENAGLVNGMVKAEEEARKSLREKEVLLKEVHHRVKNNLQIISSLLNLQMPHIRDSQAVELFRESQNRVISMALIHEKLYQSESLAGIDVAGYIHSLADNLLRSYGAAGQAVKLKIDAADIALDIDTVIPCALIINELVSNALKHAFPDAWRRAGGTGEVRIALHREAGHRFALTVTDNGVGLPAGFDAQKCESLGLKLVGALVKQLRGAHQLGPGDGTGAGFTITFEARVQEKSY